MKKQSAVSLHTIALVLKSGTTQQKDLTLFRLQVTVALTGERGGMWVEKNNCTYDTNNQWVARLVLTLKCNP
jgi:hypothetical protein